MDFAHPGPIQQALACLYRGDTAGAIDVLELAEAATDKPTEGRPLPHMNEGAGIDP